MLVSHHAAISALAAVVAAPVVKNKASLGVFWAAAVGQDVDHYLWYALKFRNPSLRDAYRFFRRQYGKRSQAVERENARALHGPLPLVLITIVSLWDRRLLPVAVGMGFHGLLDAMNEWLTMPAMSRECERPAPVWREWRPQVGRPEARQREAA